MAIISKEVKDFLGEKNIEKFKQKLVELILQRIEIDFEEYDYQLLDFNYIQEMLDEYKEQAYANVQEKIIKHMEEKINSCYSTKE